MNQVFGRDDPRPQYEWLIVYAYDREDQFDYGFGWEIVKTESVTGEYLIKFIDWLKREKGMGNVVPMNVVKLC